MNIRPLCMGRNVFEILWVDIRAITHLNCWDDEPLIAVEGLNQLHVVFRQRKVKHKQVLLDPGRCHAFRNTHHTPLNVPPTVSKHNIINLWYNKTMEARASGKTKHSMVNQIVDCFEVEKVLSSYLSMTCAGVFWYL